MINFKKIKLVLIILLLISAMILFNFIFHKGINSRFERHYYSDANIENSIIISKYNNLVSSNSSLDEILKFVDENIKTSNKYEANELIYDLIKSSSNNIDIDLSSLNKYNDYISNDMKSFLSLVIDAQKNPIISNNSISLNLEELLVKSESIEKHIKNFPKSKTKDDSFKLYCTYMGTAITGYYDSEEFNDSNIYLNDTGVRLDVRAVNIYKKFSQNNNSKTADIIKKYLSILRNSKWRTDTNAVQDFYKYRYELFRSELNI